MYKHVQEEKEWRCKKKNVRMEDLLVGISQNMRIGIARDIYRSENYFLEFEYDDKMILLVGRGSLE